MVWQAAVSLSGSHTNQMPQDQKLPCGALSLSVHANLHIPALSWQEYPGSLVAAHDIVHL